MTFSNRSEDGLYISNHHEARTRVNGSLLNMSDFFLTGNTVAAIARNGERRFLVGAAFAYGRTITVDTSGDRTEKYRCRPLSDYDEASAKADLERYRASEGLDLEIVLLTNQSLGKNLVEPEAIEIAQNSYKHEFP